MGETGQACGLPHAASGRAPGRLAARRSLKSFWADESGVTAVEIGLLVGLIAVVLISAMTTLGANIKNTMGKASGAVG